MSPSSALERASSLPSSPQIFMKAEQVTQEQQHSGTYRRSSTANLLTMQRRNSLSRIRPASSLHTFNNKRREYEIHAILKSVEEHRSSFTQDDLDLEDELFESSEGESSSQENEESIPRELREYKTLHFPSGDLFSGHVHVETGEMIYGRLTSTREMEVYEGPFLRGKKHGDGAVCVKMDNSGKFLGRYHEGTMHSGTLIVTRGLSSDFTYTGSFLHGDFHGVGKIATQNGSIYQGTFERGLFHGSGTLRMVHEDGGGGKTAEESVYTGDFCEGLFHGSGTMVYPDLSSYAGTWEHGQKLEGTETASNGNVFEGKFLNGIRHGMGVLKLKNGRVTKRGVWRGEELREDVDVCISFADGREYTGEHVAGRPHGFGEMEYATFGTRAVTYTGQFFNGFRHGEGQAIFHNSSEEYEGDWVCDEPVDLKIFQHNGPVLEEYEEEMIQVFTVPMGDPDERPGRSLIASTSKVFAGSNQDLSSTAGESLTGSLLTFISLDDTEDSTTSAKASKSPETVPPKKERRQRKRRSIKAVDFEGNLDRLDLSLKTLSMVDFGDIAPTVYHYANGDVFKGYLDANNLRQGTGVYTEHRMGSIYEGDWKDSMRHGVGLLTLASGVEYSGEFFKDSIHGQGVITLIDDSVYTGGFHNGSFHGHGTLEDESTKRVYIGEFENGLRHGDGQETFSDGSRYVGQYQFGYRHGTGVLYDSTGKELYRGEWFDDLRQGRGHLLYHKHQGSSWEGNYEGDFHCGKFCGMGLYSYTDGTSIEGQWVDDVPRDGDWTINYPDGSKFYGFATFYPEENQTSTSTVDCLRVPLPHGFGTLTYPSGQRYVGNFEYGEYQDLRR